jgi:hypothetical protein
MLEFVRGRVSDRKLRLFAAACCRSVQTHLWTAASGPAIDLAEQVADGLATVAELTAPRGAIHDGLELYPGEPVYDPAYYACGTDPPGDAEWCAFYAANVSTRPIDIHADALLEATRAAELSRQCGFLRDCVPVHSTAVDPSWRTEAVVALSRGMYETRDFALMPVWADALEDAGCADPDVLAHCRDGGPHVRGCWVIDVLLGMA